MSFRAKLLVAMMAVVAGVTGATLLATQQNVQAAYERLFENQFQSQLAFFGELQEARLGTIKEKSLAFVNSIRLIAAMNEFIQETNAATIDDLYDNARNELAKPGASGTGAAEPAFFRFMDEKGAVIVPTDPRTGLNRGTTKGQVESRLATISKALAGAEQQQVGYLAFATETNPPQIHEVIFTKIVDPVTDRILGAVVLGFPLPTQSGKAAATLKTGIFLEGQIHGEAVVASLAAPVAEALRAGDPARDHFQASIGGAPHAVFFRALNAGSDFPKAHQICVYSLEESLGQQRDLRRKVLLFGGLALAGALVMSLFLAHSLSVPIRELVGGTVEVRKGNFAVTVPVRSEDEIGQLAKSFNEMTAGLALKEKYRSVLDLVADKGIAEDLINGKIALGGEERDIAVLFCDIRGFTALTQNMAPPEVITMLNEHFTPLTKVVYEHHGVVDKFVGDLIMAVFGAPKGDGNEAFAAASCALRMIEERSKLNESSKYQIAVGIGVASGRAVAGRMGSADRLNYTVLGERVNLAARLCSQAARMDVVIDETTYQACRDRMTTEPLPPVKLKGFSDLVQAYKLKELRTPASTTSV